MKKIYLDPKIYYIENVLSKEELLKINLYYDDNIKDFEKVGHFFHLFKSLPKDILEIYEKLNKTISSSIDNQQSHVHFSKTIQFYNSDIGENQWAIPPHCDKFEKDKYSDSNANSNGVVLGYIFYFNDDYEGGEVVYLNKNISFRPKSGDLLIHDGSIEYIHAVKRVTKGQRRFSTGFTYENGYCKDH